LPETSSENETQTLETSSREARKMKMRFILTMEDLEVEDKRIDSLTVDWTEEVTQEQVLSMSREWISAQNFLSQRMVGLSKVGESTLTIEPVFASEEGSDPCR